MSILDSNNELTSLLNQWERDYEDNNFLPLEILRRMSELIEKETEAYYRTDPDPFDDRHPGRTRPESALGILLKNLFKNDNFMNKLVNVYIMHRDNEELQTLSCRLLYVLLPGLESSAVFNDSESFVNLLYKWAEKANEPLRSYATGLLAAAMLIPDLAASFKDRNVHLIPIMLRRLKELNSTDNINNSKDVNISPESTCSKNVFKVKDLNNSQSLNNCSDKNLTFDSELNGELKISEKNKLENKTAKNKFNENDNTSKQPFKKFKASSLDKKFDTTRNQFNNGANSISLLSPSHLNSECSNSSWAELEPYMIGKFCMYPLTREMQQRFILQYLAPMGDYQELLCYVFENKALDLIMHYIDIKKNHDIRLSFESLKYLASLLCHKKFALEFLNVGGLQKLLQVYRPSVAATGVSICLYYLAYNEDSMERICLLPKNVLKDLVNYALWLLECSHESSRCQATMFFSVSFAFRVILELFDSQDGLRKLLNVIFILDLFSESENSTDDELFTKRQTARHVSIALKHYFEAHLIVECEQLRRSQLAKANQTNHNLFHNNYNKLSICNTSAYKAIKYTSETIIEFVETFLEIMPLRKSWKPVESFISLGGVKLIINLISASFHWNYNGKIETMKSALDILVVCSALPKLQYNLTEKIPLECSNRGEITVNNVMPLKVIILATDDKYVEHAEVQCSALQIIINCCCGPLNKFGSSSNRLFTNNLTLTPNNNLTGHISSNKLINSNKKNKLYKTGEDLLNKMWNSVRFNNGIMVLINLLTIKTPITHADKIRMLACKALCGLARNEIVQQILKNLSIFISGQLQHLMKEPILQERIQEHIQFTKYCKILVERVTGSFISNSIESTSTANITRAGVVAQTKITYNKKELLYLIYQYLLNQGFKDTSQLKEVNLASSTTNTSLMWPSSTPNGILSQKTKKPRPNLINDCTSSPNFSNKKLHFENSIKYSPLALQIKHNRNHNNNLNSPSTLNQDLVCNNSIEIHNNILDQSMTSTPCSLPNSKSMFHFHSTGITPITLNQKNNLNDFNKQTSSVTLDGIVVEYLRKQHSLCKHPIHTCPPFDLFQPHKCPEPRFKNRAPINCALRLTRREIQPRFGGIDGQKWDRQLIYSKFRPIKTFREGEGVSSFTCCAFSRVNHFFFLGNSVGELSVYNLYSSVLEASYSCHNSLITYVEPSRDGKLVLTCSLWPHVSVLWTFTDIFEMKMSFDEDPYVEFSKNSQDKALGTNGIKAHLYDLNAGTIVQTFENHDLTNYYTKNKATFNMTDELILNDGIMWDVRSGSLIHKFDKFNKHINGVFHPNSWEIISNSEIWDIRTYRLLKSIPALDQCQIKFNQTGDVFYGAIFEDENIEDEEQNRSPFDSSFRTFDAYDYSNIATIDVKKNIHDLSTDPGDCYVATIENNNSHVHSNESVCRLYEVGRYKEEDEHDDDEEEEEENDVDDDDEDDDDDVVDPDTEEEEFVIGMNRHTRPLFQMNDNVISETETVSFDETSSDDTFSDDYDSDEDSSEDEEEEEDNEE